MASARRLQVLQQQLTGPQPAETGLSVQLTAGADHSPGCCQEEQSYSVTLPEQLTSSGPWVVRRSAGGVVGRCRQACQVQNMTRAGPRAPTNLPEAGAVASGRADTSAAAAACSAHTPLPPAPCRRNALSPRKLVDTFPAPHDDVHTLYDNLESSIAEFGNVRASSRGGREACGSEKLAIPVAVHQRSGAS